MVVTSVIATPIAADAEAADRNGQIGVALYQSGTSRLAGLGGRLHDSATRFLPSPPSVVAWDFLSIALAAFAADRMVLRSNAEDGWTRAIALNIALSEPERWNGELPSLEQALRFLTGDIWQISLRGGGSVPPLFNPKLTDRDAICLFSGGLDSLLGAMKLLNDGRTPFLVSQGSAKEIGPQLRLARAIGLEHHRFDGRANERWRPPYEGSTRGRSLIFFAYGVLAASAHGLNEVVVPENGLIAINPPFTRRRMGSLSTRTTHPHFLKALEDILQSVELNVRLNNIFEGHTKGEMIAENQHPELAQLAASSYSCGKGKRRNGQCGRCVPCLIRRAAFHRAGIPDQSTYFSDLSLSVKNDDVLAARRAGARASALTQTDDSHSVRSVRFC